MSKFYAQPWGEKICVDAYEWGQKFIIFLESKRLAEWAAEKIKMGMYMCKKRGNMIEYTVKVYPDGSQKWYLNGRLHREGGPAVIWESRAKQWFLNDKLHREDGPAIIYANGTKEWYLNGERHREGGPAVIYADGTQYWYLNGKEFAEEEYRKQTSPASCAGKVVEIEGKKYRLEEI